jgi:hypothetical protein
VSTSIELNARPDLVVVLNGASALIPQAASVLARGGVIYCEVSRQLAQGRTPARTLRFLQRTGITPAAAYWVVPGFERALRFVPLDHRGALEWYFRDVLQRPTVARAALTLIGRSIAMASPATFACLAPCFSVVGVAGSTAAVPSVLEAHRLGKGSGIDSVALVTSGQDDGSRVVLLPFRAGERAPTAAVKVARLSCSNDRTCSEHATLKEIRRRLPYARADSVPAAEALNTWNQLSVAVESPARGPTILVSSGSCLASRAERIADLQLTADWLREFNRACTTRVLSAFEIVGRIEQPIAAFTRAFGSTPDREQLFARVRRDAAALSPAPLPEVIQHNDLGPWNVHRHGRRVTVIDWEFDRAARADRRGLPMTDLVYFVSYWLFTARRLRSPHARRSAFAQLFTSIPAEPLAAAAHRELNFYLREMGIRAEYAPLLVTLTWIERALDRLTRADSGSGPDRVSETYCEHVDLLAAHLDGFWSSQLG